MFLFVFFPYMSLRVTTKQLQFGLICPRDIVPEFLWFVQMQFCEPQSWFHLLFRQKMIPPGNPSKEIVLVQSSSNCCHGLRHLTSSVRPGGSEI